MKTLVEFIKEITASKELQDEMKNLEDEEAINTFFKAHDCDATAEDFGLLVKYIENSEGELPDDLAEAVAGGFPFGCSTPMQTDTPSQRPARRPAMTPEEYLRSLGIAVK